MLVAANLRVSFKVLMRRSMIKIQVHIIIFFLLVGCDASTTDEELGTNSDSDEDVKNLTEQVVEHHGIAFVWVPPGEKMIGTNNSQAELTEKPQVLLELEEGFYIGRTEVTADQYLKLFPSASGLYAEGQQPVRIKWSDAKKFCGKLNHLRIKEGEQKGVFRLPYEFEWEYVATYGRPLNDDWWPTHSRHPDVMLAEYENYDINYDNPVDSEENSVRDVQQFKPNELGAYDVLGNVSEWCEGDFAISVVSMIDMDYKKGTDFQGQKPIRGGDYLDSINKLRPSIRRSRRDHHVAGFRVLFDPYSDLNGSEKETMKAGSPGGR